MTVEEKEFADILAAADRRDEEGRAVVHALVVRVGPVLSRTRQFSQLGP